MSNAPQARDSASAQSNPWPLANASILRGTNLLARVG